MALTNPKKLNMHLKAGMPDGYLVAAEDIKDETRDQNLQDSLDELFNAKDNGGNNEGGISEETDPIFTASPAHSITNENIASWNAKSDFSGSYEDLTDKPENGIILHGIPLPSPTSTSEEMEESIMQLGYAEEQSVVDAAFDKYFESGGTYEIIIALNDVPIDQNEEGEVELRSVWLTSSQAFSMGSLEERNQALVFNLKESLLEKPNTIIELELLAGKEGILAKMSMGLNEIQVDWNEENSESRAFIKNKPSIPSIEGLATETFVTTKIAEAALEGNEVDLSGYATKDDLNGKVDKISGKGLSTNDLTNELVGKINNAIYIETDPVFKASPAGSITASNIEGWNAKSDFSGSYNDLTDKPSIPSIEGLISKDEADTTYQAKGNYLTEHQDLSSYAKKSDVPSIEGLLSSTEAAATYQPKGSYLTEHQSLSAYLKSSDAAKTYQPKGDYLTEHQSLVDYALKSEIPSTAGLLSETKAASTYQPKGNYLTEHQSLEGYAKKTDIPSLDGLLSETVADATYQAKGNYLTEHQSLEAYLKSADAAKTYQPKGNYALSSDIPSLTGYATENFVTSQGYLTEHQSLDGYATEDYVTSAINNAKLEGGDNDIDLSTYATKSWVEQQSYLKEHQSLANYAKKSEIPSIEGLASEEFVTSQGYLTEHQSLEAYAKKSEVPSITGLLSETKAAQTYQPKGTYLTEHQSLEAYAKKTEIPSLDGYATENFVTSQGYLTEHQSLEAYAKKSEVPSITGLLSETKAAQTYQPIGDYLTEHQSLADYAKKSEIPSISGLLSETKAAQTYQAKGDYLTEHQSLEAYAKKSEVPSISGLLSETKAAQTYQPKGSYLTSYTETDPVFKASPAGSITANDITSWNAKSEFSGSYNDLTDKPSIPSVAGLISKTTADATYQPKGAYLTEHQSLDGYATEDFVTSQGYLKEHQSLTDYLKSADAAKTYQPKGSYLTSYTESDPVFKASAAYGIKSSDITTWNNKSDFSGSYNDLSDKPTIPSISGLLSETKAAQTYQAKGSYLTTESDPIFSASPAYGITEENIESWNSKSTFSGSYSDLTGKPNIPSIEGLISKTDADKAYQPKGSYLTSYAETDPVFKASAAYGIKASDITSWNSKSTFSGSYNDLEDKPSIPSIAGLISKTDADKAYQPKGSYLTSYTETDPVFKASAAYGIKASDITSWNAKSDFSGSYDDLTNKPTIPSIEGLAKSSEVTSAISAANNYTNTAISNLVSTAPEALNTLNELAAALGNDANFSTTVSTELGKKANTADLASVATSGSYEDLSDKPTIPSISGLLSETKAASTYQPKGNYLTTESDPVFKASAAYGIKASDITAWNSKSTFSGSYNDLSDKPSIPSISGLLSETKAAQTYQPKGSYLTSYTESDPIFSASPAYGITDEKIASWNAKSDFSGSYDDLIGKPEIPSIVGLISKTDADKAYQPKGSYLTSYTETDPVFKASAAYGIKASDITSWNAKSDFSGSYNDLEDKPSIPSISGLLSETKAAQTYQPKGSYLTEHQSLEGYATESWVEDKGYLTEHQSLANYALKSEVPSITGLLSETKAAQTYQPKGTYLTEHQSLVDYAKKTDIPSIDGLILESTADEKYQEKISAELINYLQHLKNSQYTYSGEITANVERVVIPTTKSVTFTATFTSDGDDITSVTTTTSGWTSIGKTLQKTVTVTNSSTEITSGTLTATLHLANGEIREITLNKTVEIDKPWFVFEAGETVTTTVLGNLISGSKEALIKRTGKVEGLSESAEIFTTGNYMWLAIPNTCETGIIGQLGSNMAEEITTITSTYGNYKLYRSRISLHSGVFEIELTIN